MSETIGTVQGKMEVEIITVKDISHIDTTLHIASLYGGDLRGPCLQLELDEEHIQLDMNSVEYLRDKLSSWLKEHKGYVRPYGGKEPDV